MPVEDTPNFLREDTERKPVQWIEDAAFSLHMSKLPSMDQVRAMTNAAFDAAAASEMAAETHAATNTPDNRAPEPRSNEMLNYNLLSEKELSARIEEFRTALLQDEELKLFVSEPVNAEGKNRGDFDLAS